MIRASRQQQERESVQIDGVMADPSVAGNTHKLIILTEEQIYHSSNNPLPMTWPVNGKVTRSRKRCTHLTVSLVCESLSQCILTRLLFNCDCSSSIHRCRCCRVTHATHAHRDTCIRWEMKRVREWEIHIRREREWTHSEYTENCFTMAMEKLKKWICTWLFSALVTCASGSGLAMWYIEREREENKETESSDYCRVYAPLAEKEREQKMVKWRQESWFNYRREWPSWQAHDVDQMNGTMETTTRLNDDHTLLIVSSLTLWLLSLQLRTIILSLATRVSTVEVKETLAFKYSMVHGIHVLNGTREGRRKKQVSLDP